MASKREHSEEDFGDRISNFKGVLNINLKWQMCIKILEQVLEWCEESFCWLIAFYRSAKDATSIQLSGL